MSPGRLHPDWLKPVKPPRPYSNPPPNRPDRQARPAQPPPAAWSHWDDYHEPEVPPGLDTAERAERDLALYFRTWQAERERLAHLDQSNGRGEPHE